MSIGAPQKHRARPPGDCVGSLWPVSHIAYFQETKLAGAVCLKIFVAQLRQQRAPGDFVRIVESNSLSVITYNPLADTLA
jgi:hypothetical protein